MAEFALYAWGSFIHEAGLDRLPGWLAPAVLRGERAFVHDSLAMSDEGPIPVDASTSLFNIGADPTDTYVAGRDLPLPPAAGWRVAYLRLVTDGTVEGAERLIAEIEEQGTELDRDDEPGTNPLPLGEVVAVWEDPHGQWDVALVELGAPA